MHEPSDAPARPPRVGIGATQQDGLLRAQRLARVRAAFSVVATSLGAADAEHLASFTRKLDDRLTLVCEQLRAADARRRIDPDATLLEVDDAPTELRIIDADLKRLATSLRAVVDGLPPPELAAALEQIADASRNAVVALLDLLLEDEGRIAERSETVLLLVVWASCESQNGRRRVVRDPATITAEMRSFTARCAAASNADLVAAEQAFMAAARLDPESPDAALVAEMKARETQLGLAVFAPSLLRAVVFFEATLVRAGAPLRAAFAEIAPIAERKVAWATAPAASRTRVAKAAVESAVAATVPGDVRWRIHDAPPEAPPAPPPSPARRALARHGWRVVKFACVALLLGTTVYTWSGKPGNIRNLSKQDLGAISASLASAYRDSDGTGALLVGTVGPQWDRYSQVQRENDAKNIVARLGTSGVREVLLYDSARRVAVHQTQGNPLRVGP